MASTKNIKDLVRIRLPNGRITTRRKKRYSIPTSSRSSPPEPKILHYTDKHRTRVCRCLDHASHKTPRPIPLDDSYLEASLMRYLIQHRLESCAVSEFRTYEQSVRVRWSLRDVRVLDFHYVDDEMDLVCRCREGKKHGVGFVQPGEVRDFCAEFFAANPAKLTCCREKWGRVKSGELAFEGRIGERVEERNYGAEGSRDKSLFLDERHGWLPEEPSALKTSMYSSVSEFRSAERNATRVHLRGSYCDGSHECYPLSPHSSDSDSDSDSSLAPLSSQTSRTYTQWSEKIEDPAPLPDQHKDAHHGRSLLQTRKKQQSPKPPRNHGTRRQYDASMAHLRNGIDTEPDIPEHIWRSARPSLHTNKRNSGSAVSTPLGTEIASIVRTGGDICGDKASEKTSLDRAPCIPVATTNVAGTNDPTHSAANCENTAAQSSVEDAAPRPSMTPSGPQGAGATENPDITDASTNKSPRSSMEPASPRPSVNISTSDYVISAADLDVLPQGSETHESPDIHDIDQHTPVEEQDPALWLAPLSETLHLYPSDGSLGLYQRGRSSSVESIRKDVSVGGMSLDGVGSGIHSSSEAEPLSLRSNGELDELCGELFPGGDVFESDGRDIYESDGREIYESDAKEVGESNGTQPCGSSARDVHESGAREVYESDAREILESSSERVYEDDVGNNSGRDACQIDGKEMDHANKSATQGLHGDHDTRHDESDTRENHKDTRDGEQVCESDARSIYESDGIQTDNGEKHDVHGTNSKSNYEKNDNTRSLTEDKGESLSLVKEVNDESTANVKDAGTEPHDHSLPSTKIDVDGPASQPNNLDTDAIQTNETQNENMASLPLHEKDVESHSLPSLGDETIQQELYTLDYSLVEKTVTEIHRNDAGQKNDDTIGSAYPDADKSHSSSDLDNESSVRHSNELNPSVLLPNPSMPSIDLSSQAATKTVDAAKEGRIGFSIPIVTLEAEPYTTRSGSSLGDNEKEVKDDSTEKQRKRCSIRVDRSSVGSIPSTRSSKRMSLIFRRVKPEGLLPTEEDFFNQHVQICSRTHPAPLGVCSLCHTSLNIANHKAIKIPDCEHYFHRSCLVSHFRVRDRDWEVCPDCGIDLCVRDLDDRVDADRVAVFKGKNTNLRERRIDITMPLDGTIMTCETQEAIAAAHLRILKDYVFFHAEKLYMEWKANRQEYSWFNAVVLPASKDFKKWNIPTRQHGFLINRDEFQRLIIWAELVRLMTTIRAEKRKTSEPFPDLVDLYAMFQRAKNRYDERKKGWIRKHDPEPEYDKIASNVYDLAEDTYNNDLI